MGAFWDSAFPYVAALLPTIGTVFLFYFIMKYIFEGDRRERIAQEQWEAEHPAVHRTPSVPTAPARGPEGSIGEGGQADAADKSGTAEGPRSGGGEGPGSLDDFLTNDG